MKSLDEDELRELKREARTARLLGILALAVSIIAFAFFTTSSMLMRQLENVFPPHQGPPANPPTPTPP
jgi:hypothetical protein